MAEGWLCVSTLKQTSTSSSNRTTPALSAKTLTSQSRSRSCVALKIVCFRRLSIVRPSNSTRPRRVLCEQCSLQVCARVSSSQSVGSRPSAAKWAPDRPHLGRAQGELARAAQVRQARRPCPGSAPRCGGSGTGAPAPGGRRASAPTTACSTASLARTRRINAGQGRGRALDPVGADRPDVLDGEAQVAQDRPGALGLGVGDAGLGQDVDDVPAGGGGPSGRSAPPRAPGRTGGWRRSRRPGRPGRPRRRGAGRPAERALDEESPAGADVPGAGQAEVGRLGRDALSFGVGPSGGGVDLKMPERLGQAFGSWAGGATPAGRGAGRRDDGGCRIVGLVFFCRVRATHLLRIGPRREGALHAPLRKTRDSMDSV
jgi:hypothetical protein